MTSNATDRSSRVGDVGIKAPCRAATTAAITLNGTQTIDTVAVVAGDRVLVKNQSSGVDNGIYVADTGAWQRAADCDGPYDLADGTIVRVNEGTNSGFWYVDATDPITVGTTSITFGMASSTLAVISAFMQTVLDDANAATAAATLAVLPLAGGTMTGNIVMSASQIRFAQPLASETAAATIDLAALLGNSQTYTNSSGALTITSFGTVPFGTWFDIQFGITGGSVTIQDNAAISCLGDADIEVRHLDKIRIRGGAGGVATITSVNRYDGTALSPSARFQPLTASVDGANQLVITLGKGAVLNFSNGKTLALTAAISVTVPSGATMGTSNGVANRLWVAALYNSGVPELAIINTWDGTDVHMISPTDEITTVAMGTGSDSAHVWYSTTLRSSQPIAIGGYVESTQATAGAWATSPSKTQGYGLDVPLPGQVVQERRSSSTATQTGTTTLPADNTIPQVTEGDQYYSKAITPKSALNLVECAWEMQVSNSSNGAVTSAIFCTQYHPTNALACVHNGVTGVSNNPFNHVGRYRTVAGTTSSITWNLRAGANSAGTTRVNDLGTGTASLGSTIHSGLTLREIQR